jgi:hypothetical protein
MAIGGLLGSLFGPIFGTAAGMMIGGFIGKNRMEVETTQGRKVSDTPSFWNKDTLLGGLIGLVSGGLVGMVIAAAGIAIAASGGPIAGLSLAAAGLLAGTAVATFAGAVIGGKHGQKRLLDDYRQAALQEQQRQPAATPDFSVELDMQPGKSFAQDIELQRKQAATQRTL